MREGINMSALIEEFKREHYGIVDALQEVKECGILTKEGQAKLVSVKAAKRNAAREHRKRAKRACHGGRQGEWRLRWMLGF
jgi:hypothetical protein